MKIEFTNPAALILLVSVPAALYLARHSLTNLSRRRALSSQVARTLILVLIVFALAGLRVRSSSRDLALIFLVDVSASVAPDEQAAAVQLINREIDRAAARDYLSVIAFAREPSVELAPTRKEELGDWRLAEISSNPPRNYTNVAAALRLAAALVPESAVGRFVLISDGNENLESSSQEAQLLKAEGVEVYTLALDTASHRGREQGEVAVRELAAPEMLAEGESFDLKITVDSTRDTDAVLRVFRNDSLVAERGVQLAASGENVFLVPQRNEQKGFYTYRAEVEALHSDTFAQNNSREAFAMVEGRPKTLYLYGDDQPSPAIMRVLTEGQFAADARRPELAPTTLAGFQNYDLVIFDNVPAAALTKEQMKMVQSYVRDLGGGFFMIGGDQSFGPGGYYKTPIEETLPVSLDVRQKKHFPSLALALVIDKSGSMAGSKMRLAREAASVTVDFLNERDSVGVIAFDDEAHPVVNLTPVENKRAIINQINSIQALGGTQIYPGLRMAYEWLLASDAQIKHIILLSDGQSEGDFPGITRAITDSGMTLSAVAVGEDADHQLMQMLAANGGGRFYATESGENLPRIFAREAFLASGSTIIEEPFAPKLVRPAQATAGIDWAAAPELGGYVGTAERDQLNSPAITSLLSHKDDPLYAVWQYGLGRSAAFTSDAKSRWAAAWMNWPGFGQFWTQAFRDVLRREGATDLTPSVEIRAGRGRVAVEAVAPDGRYKNNLRLRARVVAPDFSATDITLEQTAAGQYEGEFAATERGAYLVSVAEEGGQSAPITGSVNSYSPEFMIATSDANQLAQISEATGGKLISAEAGAAEGDANLFERTRARTHPRDIWQVLVLVALLLLPADVGVRRVQITREQWERAREWVRSRLRREQALEAAGEGAVSLSQLKSARTRVRLADAEASAADATSTPAATSEAAMASKAALRKDRSPAAPPIKAEPVKAKSIKPETVEAETVKAEPLSSRLLDAKRKRRE